jgi:AcrR family transcriptional regulator
MARAPSRRGRRPAPALATADELRGALPPKQIRSVDAIQRIAIAGRRLFDERDYDAVSVADIAAGAGMSVGAFYTRFPSKEHLVVHLIGDLADELAAAAHDELSADRLTGRTLADVVRLYFARMAEAFVRHRGVLRPATLIARQTQDAELRALLRRFNADMHGRIRALLLERLPGMPREIAAARIDMAILWSSAAMREVLLYGEPVSSLSRRDTVLVDELTRAVTLYLGA